MKILNEFWRQIFAFSLVNKHVLDTEIAAVRVLCPF